MRTPAIVIGLATGAVLLAGAVAATTASADTTGSTTTGADGAPDATPTPRYGPVQREVLALVNARRTWHGCPELTLDDRLIAAAREHAVDMADREYFAHESPAGDGSADRMTDAGYRWSRYAENIARGQDSPEEVVDAWMASPAHRENILDCRLDQVGLGLSYDADRTPYWVQDFASPR